MSLTEGGEPGGGRPPPPDVAARGCKQVTERRHRGRGGRIHRRDPRSVEKAKATPGSVRLVRGPRVMKDTGGKATRRL